MESMHLKLTFPGCIIVLISINKSDSAGYIMINRVTLIHFVLHSNKSPTLISILKLQHREETQAGI